MYSLSYVQVPIDILGSGNVLLWEGYPVHWRMFISIPGLYSLGVSSTALQSCQPKMSTDIAKYPLGKKATPSWEALS